MKVRFRRINRLFLLALSAILILTSSAMTRRVSAADDLSGTITISLQSNDTQTWQAVAQAYTAKHPNVKVNVELKPGDGYQEFIRAQFAAGTPSFSLVNANVVADLINNRKFVDFTSYLDENSPYTGKPWREDMDAAALQNMYNPTSGTIPMLNLETVQVAWFYNKTAFQKAGILDDANTVAKTANNQPTWSQLIGWCDKLKTAGYIPVAIEGDFTSFWQFRFGWLARMYLDQFSRDEANIVRAQPGDWDYQDGVDDKWKYDAMDPYNDDAIKVTFNNARRFAALRDGKISVDSPAFKALYTNFKQFADHCTPDGWLGTSDAYPLFLTQKAAIRLDGAWFLTNFERDIKSLAEGKYVNPNTGSSDTTPTPMPSQNVSAFDYGSFNNPSMEGQYVQAPARTIEVNIGFWGIPIKDQAQNDLEVDFLMYLTSPEGYGLYLKNKLDPNNLNGGINGPPVVKNVQLPDPYPARFASLKLIGNTEKDTPGTFVSRGVSDYQPSVREWVDLAQQYFSGKMTVDDFTSKYEASIKQLFPDILKSVGLSADDLDHPEKKPASQS